MRKQVSLSAALCFGALSLAPARAALPPRFTTWANFAAVVAEPSIPDVLGTVDRIERTPQGKFIVRGGACFVEVTVIRGTPAGPDGKIVVGPSRVLRVNVGQKRCDK